MSDIKQCPFCGKPVREDENVCEECKDHMDHQYTTDFLDDDRINKPLPDLPVESDKVDSTPPIEERLEGNNIAEPSPEEPKRHSKMSKGIIFLILGSAILVVIGVVGALDIARSRNSEATQEAYWMKCVEENTPLSYSKYLVRYPEGNFADEAEKRIRASRE